MAGTPTILPDKFKFPRQLCLRVPRPDPLVTNTYPRIRVRILIRIKISRITSIELKVQTAQQYTEDKGTAHI